MSASDSSIEVGYRSRALPGEAVCGDRCGAWRDGAVLTLAVADGLGHGPQAEKAALAAIDCIDAGLHRSLEEQFAVCDERLHRTRGAALAIAVIDRASHRLTLASVGNVRAVLLTSAHEYRLGGACGIVGAGFNRLAPEHRTLAPGDILALYSDGLDELIPLREVLQATHFCPQCASEEALKRWATDKDDAAILIYRHGG